MKILFYILNIFFLLQDNDPLLIKGKDYQGYVFPEGHFVMMSIEGQARRYTPMKSEIEIAEQLLKRKIAFLNKKHINQGGSCPIIDKNLKMYKRQYVGFVNKQGQKIIWINFIWDKELGTSLSEDIISAYDGCSYYWKVKINISNKTVYDLHVNGRG